MTPEERAKEVVLIGHKESDALVQHVRSQVAAIIRDAMLSCAELAEETTRQPMDYIDWSPGPAADDRARRIAAAIRARTNT